MNLNQEEITILNITMRNLVLKKRTGEIGIMHGADRFVSTQLCLRKVDIKHLNNAFKKLGIASEIKSI